MMSKENILKSYELAKESYASIGVNTDDAIKALDKVEISLHCWQGDDVAGFEHSSGSLTGGIMATGNCPGRARTPEELRTDLDKAMSLLPGTQKVNVHALYLDTKGKKVDRNEIEPEHFSSWAEWAKQQGIGLDFNPSFFSHPKSADGFTLSSGDKGIRDFWIEHGKRSRKIAEYFGKTTGKTCVTNIWIPDGYKDNPIDRLAPRQRLEAALDEMLSEKIDTKYNKDAVESKLFGIGSEAYVTGSHEFYMGYAATRKEKNVLLTLDAGHFHPTEVISAKISALLLFVDELLLHVSRPVRWDSDHVVILDDELQAIMNEIIRCEVLNKVNIALDYFDASINRIAAWVVGARNTQKALLKAMLEPVAALKKAEAEGDYTTRLALTEEYKSYPYNAVWDYYCLTKNVPAKENWLAEVKTYEKEVLLKR
jgi:L-rhamnose isomerase